ncbi:MAG: FMN-binding glutamate synthase family protein [Gammaproteobacteria bacterium]|nr:FMN-binding glutamate synthase family protein [Gammaproteobacteria bacterium]
MLSAASIPLALQRPAWLFLLLPAALLSMLGTLDLLQRKQNLRRNYPVIAHFRYLFEALRPAIRQYLFESEEDGRPFPREQRSLVYRRAKGVNDKMPFGTLRDFYAPGHEWINHSVMPTSPLDVSLRVNVGGPDCKQPYSASVFNISAMSFGSLSANAIRALNRGAKLGGFAHDTGEGGISPHHREGGGDLIWEIGSGYFGCRDRDGRFDSGRFAERAVDSQVKMLEIKLSQGAKPGSGGILPAAKVSHEIALTRDVPMGVDCVSPSAHHAFSTPIELLEFLARLREMSGGKPTGFKLCIGHPVEFMAIAKAMLATGIKPDFIVIDGAEGGTGAAPLELANRVGTPLREGLIFARNVLVGAGLRDGIRLGASGKVTSGYHLASNMALGADWCNAGRGFMFALGCIQSLACHTDHCPTGIATQDPFRQRGLVVTDKAHRVANFHTATLKALATITASAGMHHPEELQPHHLQRRTGDLEVQSAAELYTFLEPGELLSDPPAAFAGPWRAAKAEQFSFV